MPDDFSLSHTVIGLGEIGLPLYNILKQHFPDTRGVDTDPHKTPDYNKTPENPIMAHICVPSDQVENAIKAVLKYENAEYVVIHGTISPGTTFLLQRKFPNTHFLYSPVRGTHRRMQQDLLLYTKFYAAPTNNKKTNQTEHLFTQTMFACGIKTCSMPDSLTLEFAKIVCDTTYYGFLISYAQATKILCDANGINYDTMWKFAEETHAELGNRPKMFPGVIGGHCVIPNLALIKPNDLYDAIFKFVKNQNELYQTWTKVETTDTNQ